MRASQLIEYIHGQGSPMVPINLLMGTPREDMTSHVGSLLRRKFYTRVGAEGSAQGGIVQTRTANLYRRLVTELLRLRPQPNLGSPPACLNEAQREAWLQFAEHGRLVMTGGPGTGKTFVVKQMLDRLDGRHLVTIAAPTARAAALFKPSLGDGGLLRVGTVHSVLKMPPGSSPAFDLKNPLPSDVVIIDECSMMDLKLMVEMLESAPFASIMLVGDPFQLPPVSMGRPFEEIIYSGVWHVQSLQVNVRQGGNLHLVGQAVLHGEKIPTVPEVEYVPASPEEVESFVLDLIRKKARPWILAPYRSEKKTNSTSQINSHILSCLVELGELKAPPAHHPFRAEGIRVMFTRNNYKLGYLNGTLGTVVADDDRFLVQGENGVLFPLAEEELELAWASTVHKAQGSECEHVVLILPEGDNAIERSLFYTAITRARKRLTLVGRLSLLDRVSSTPYYGALSFFLEEAVYS